MKVALEAGKQRRIQFPMPPSALGALGWRGHFGHDSPDVRELRAELQARAGIQGLHEAMIGERPRCLPVRCYPCCRRPAVSRKPPLTHHTTSNTFTLLQPQRVPNAPR
jgi:hypothetical protein